MSLTTSLSEAISAPFGTVFTDLMAICHYRDGQWGDYEIGPLRPLQIQPFAHVLHYGSACFEGFKIHRWEDGSIHVFRLHSHLRRLRNSAKLLCLPIPNLEQVEAMVLEMAGRSRDWVPNPPGALYVRPTLIGTLPSIGAAASPSPEAMLYLLFSPVGAYFKRGPMPLRIAIEEEQMRTAPHFGFAKAGANYASALPLIMKARETYEVDQVLFCPNGDVQETGAANFFLINDDEIVTKDLKSSFLHGVTRDSILKLAPRIGYRVSERSFNVGEVLDWSSNGEAALSGTAAVLAGIGTFVRKNREYQVGDGNVGPNTLRLRAALRDIQTGKAEDPFGWLQRI